MYEPKQAEGGAARRRPWRGLAVGVAATALALAAAACGTTTSKPTSSASSSSSSSSGAPLKIAFLYANPVNDLGWDTAMYQGQQAVEKDFGSKVSVTTKIVPDGPQVKTLLTSLISQGYKMIVCTSFAEQTYSIPLAAANPGVKFVQVESAKTAPNLATYFTQDQDGFYIAGMAAAALSKTNTLGMVGGFPISDNLAETNGYALGAQAIKPGIKVHVTWTDNWDSVSDAQNAAQGLVNAGAGALAFLTTGPAPAQVAQRANVPWIGYQVDQSSAAPTQYLTGVLWNMVPYFVSEVKSALDGTWKTSTYYVTMKNGSVLVPKAGALWSKLPAKVVNMIEAKVKAFQTTGNPFTGPMYNQAGKRVATAGEQLTDADVATMGYLVKGVIGTVPKGA